MWNAYIMNFECFLQNNNAEERNIILFMVTLMVTYASAI